MAKNNYNRFRNVAFESSLTLLANCTRFDLLPWMGPAVRGWVMGPLKERMCLLDKSELPAQGDYCAGGSKQHACDFGRTFEGFGFGDSPMNQNQNSPMRSGWIRIAAIDQLNAARKNAESVEIPFSLQVLTDDQFDCAGFHQHLSHLPPGQLAGW